MNHISQTLNKKIHFLLFAFFFLSLNLSAQWRSANTYNGSINDIFFTDKLTGYACGVSAGLGNCSGTNSILRTVDGGQNWIRMNTGSTAAMNRLHFVDQFTGWAMGASSTVLKTTDGGQTWVSQTAGVGAGYNGIHFLTPQVGFVVGQNGIVRKSTNGGASWTTIASGSSTLRDVWFVDANIGFYVGNSGVLFKTVNGGGSFQSVYGGSDFFKDVWFADAQTGYVMSNNTLLKTTNGGSSWTTFNAEAGQIWLRMNWANATTGYIFGDNNLILKTNDGGLTWTQIASEFNDAVTCGYFINETQGFVGGDRGRVTYTNDGGNTWRNKVSGIDREYAIAYRSPEVGLMVGSGGRIFRTENAGLSHYRIDAGTGKFYASVRWVDDQVVIACGEAGSVIRSTDAGFTWQEIATGTTEFLNDIWPASDQSIFACGAAGTIIKSSDAGLTWQDQSVDTEELLDAIHFLNPQFGMAVGRDEVYRTLDGGATWELKVTDIASTTSFNDVWIVNDTLAYAAGTFGKFYRTGDAAESWEGIWPTTNTNASVEEMVFINDTVGYFARLSSQSFTLNGGFSIGSQSTYCLANNGGVDAIEIVNSNGKIYGYCSGGLSTVFHTLAPDSLTKTYLQDSIFCSGSKIFVGYLATGLLFNSETIIAQLSDASGSFDNPQNIGSYTLVSPNISPSGIITCNLPGGLNGTGFRIRVICENPMLIAPDNGFDIRIQNSITPQLNLSANPPAACGGEPVQLNASGSALGVNPQYSWTINGNPIIWESPNLLLDTLSVEAQIEVSAISSLTCSSSQSTTTSLSIEISEAPFADAGESSSICPDEEILIGNSVNGTSTWEPQTGLSDPNGAETLASPNQTTTYTLTVQNDAGCASTDSVTITVNPTPIAEAGDNVSICPNDSVQLGSITNGNSSWEPQTGLSDPNGAEIMAYPTQTTTYLLTVIDESGCTNIDSVTITLNQAPLADAGEDTGHCFSQTVQIGSPLNQNASWFPLDGLSDSSSPQPFVSLDETTTYILTVTNDLACEAYDTVVVSLYDSPDIPVIELSGGELVLPGNPQGNINWFLDGNLLEEETNDTLTINATGEYTARIENEFECSVLSDPYTVTTVTISASSLNQRAFIANTSSGWLIHVSQSDVFSYSVYDLQGRLLNSGILNQHGQCISYPSEIQGIYLIHLTDSNSNSQIFKAVR